MSADSIQTETPHEASSPAGKELAQGPLVRLVGMGSDGCASLPSRAINAIASAEVLVGGRRQLGFFPDFHGQRILLRGGLEETLETVARLAETQRVCVLASGDPLFFGVGARIVERLGMERVEILPQPSAVQWAFARVGESWEDARFLSWHGRSFQNIASRLRETRKAACLTDAERSPQRIAAQLLSYADPHWSAWVCEDLGGPGERVRRFSLPALAREDDVRPLNLLLLLRGNDWRPPPRMGFVHEDDFAKRMPRKGLITKREVRALALAALRVGAQDIVWDIGAGSGAVSIEAARLAPEGRVHAVELDAEGVALCRHNALAHGADNVCVHHGRAPQALADLESPQAVFIGGSKGSLEELIHDCLERLSPGGRLVVSAITLENIAQAHRSLREAGVPMELILVQISRGVPLAHYLRYEALNPVHLFCAQKPSAAEETHAQEAPA